MPRAYTNWKRRFLVGELERLRLRALLCVMREALELERRERRKLEQKPPPLTSA